MKLPAELIEVLEDLSGPQLRAITAVMDQVQEMLGAEVLKISIGKGDQEKEKELIFSKAQLEGAFRAQRLFLQELQRIRSEANKRVAALDAKSKKD